MISLIVAMSENRVIGRGGGLPWRLPADLAHFKRITTGHTVIMGRRTFESLGRPLPDRRNIVITRNPDYHVDGVEVTHTLDEAIRAAQEADGNAAGADSEIFILGGEQVFRLAMPRARRIYLTIVHDEFEGDTFFPALDDDAWRTVDERHHAADERNPHAMTFRILERVRASPARGNGL